MKNTKLTRRLLLITAVIFLVLDLFVPFKEHPVLDIFLWFTWLGLWITWMVFINKQIARLRLATEAMVIERHINTYTQHMIRTGILPDNVLTKSACTAYVKVMLKDEKYKDIYKTLVD